jgi:myo-inositol 2-dehydrogenase/D-chiro-inositol 1-dehydrogenase
MGVLRTRLLLDNDAVSEVYVGNRTPTRAQAALAEAGIEARAMSIEQLFARRPDALVIATATAAHGELLRRGIDVSRAIMCEKPIASTLEETLKIVEAAADARVPLQIGFMRRHDPGFRAARDAVRTGDVGTIYSIRIVSHDHEVGSDAFIEGSGGIFQDLCVHDFDVVRWLTGEDFVRVSAFGAVREHEQYARHGDFDTCLISGVLEGGALVSISGTRHDPRGYDFRVEVFGSRDSLAVGLSSQSPLNTIDEPKLLSGPVFRGFRDRFDAAFVAETNAFVDLVAGIGENSAPPEAAVAAYEVALAAERAARDGSTVRIPATKVAK